MTSSRVMPIPLSEMLSVHAFESGSPTAVPLPAGSEKENGPCQWRPPHWQSVPEEKFPCWNRQSESSCAEVHELLSENADFPYFESPNNG